MINKTNMVLGDPVTKTHSFEQRIPKILPVEKN